MSTNGTFKARWLIENLNPHYPLDLEWLVQQPELGFHKTVKIRPNPLLPPEITAFVLPHSDLSADYICYNPNYLTERIRFGVAHEIAHLYLGHEGYAIGEDEDPDIKEDADNFGSELLMPYFRVRAKYAKLHKLNPLHIVYNLKKYFWVSAEAMSRCLLLTNCITGAYFLYDNYKFYYVYLSDGLENNYEVRKMLMEEYETLRNKEYREIPYLRHGQMTKFYLHKFSNGKVFGALDIDRRHNSIEYIKISN